MTNIGEEIIVVIGGLGFLFIGIPLFFIIISLLYTWFVKVIIYPVYWLLGSKSPEDSWNNIVVEIQNIGFVLFKPVKLLFGIFGSVYLFLIVILGGGVLLFSIGAGFYVSPGITGVIIAAIAYFFFIYPRYQHALAKTKNEFKKQNED